MTIRTATRSDAPLLARLFAAVHEIHAAARPDFFKPLRGDEPALIAACADQLAQPNTTVLIAEIENEAVGYLLCIKHDIEESIYGYAHSRLYIDQMSVNPSYRSQGIGAALIAKVMQLAEAHQVQYITLNVWSFNERAQAFYRRHGFEPMTITMAIKRR